MHQFDALAIDDTQDGWIDEERTGHVLVREEESKQACALGQVGKQDQVIAAKPAIEGAFGSAIESIEERERDKFAGVEFGLAMFGQVSDNVVNTAEDAANEVFSGDGIHRVVVWTPTASVNSWLLAN